MHDFDCTYDDLSNWCFGCKNPVPDPDVVPLVFDVAWFVDIVLYQEIAFIIRVLATVVIWPSSSKTTYNYFSNSLVL